MTEPSLRSGLFREEWEIKGWVMMKISKRQTAVITAVVLCVSGSAAYEQNRKKPQVLEFGMFGDSYWEVANADGYVIIDKAIEKFEKKHPEVKIHYYSGIPKNDYEEWLSRKILQGDAPDVFMILSEDFSQMVSLGLLENLDKKIQEDASVEIRDYYETSLEAGKIDDSQYALPYETVPTLMFVNKTLLDKEGIPVPDADWSWDDLYRICKKVTKDLDGDGRLDQFGTYNYGWLEALYSNDGKIFEQQGKKCYLASEQTEAAVRFIQKLNELYQGEKVTQETFDAGNVAFMPLSFAEYRTYKTYPYKIKKYSNFQWDCITLPAGSMGDNISRVDSLLIGISSKSSQKDMAWEFLKMLTNDREIQMELFRYSQGASVLKEVTNSTEAEEILKKDTEESDKIIDHSLLNQVIMNGRVVKEFPRYKEAMALAEGEVLKLYDSSANVESSLKIAQRMVTNLLEK